MHDFGALFRRRFIRELWRRLGRDLGDRPIAIFGDGRHTAWLLETVADVEGGPTVAFILDDAIDHGSIRSSRVLHPDQADPNAVGAVLVSSDSQESALASRARAWVESAEVRPMVIEPYRGLPPGPYPQDSGSMNPILDDRRLPNGPDGDAVERGRLLGASMPVPPSGNRAGYSPETDAAYLESGKNERMMIERVLGSHGFDVRQCQDVLDWGCSTGRVLRHFDDLPERTSLWGCDIDADAIDWAQRHLGGRFRFFACTTSPTLPVPDGSFDLVYGISIFTHISHGVDTWLMELRRILRPGGAAMVTVHDEHTWSFCHDHPESYIARHCPRLDFSKPMVDDFVAHGQGPACQAFWHSRGINHRWSMAFEVAGIEPMKFCSGTQAGVVLRPRL